MTRRYLIYLIAVAVVSSVIGAGVAIGAVVYYQKQWCDLFVLLDEGYNAPVQPGQPPLTERGKRIADALHQRRVTLGCE